MDTFYKGEDIYITLRGDEVNNLDVLNFVVAIRRRDIFPSEETAYWILEKGENIKQVDENVWLGKISSDVTINMQDGVYATELAIIDNDSFGEVKKTISVNSEAFLLKPSVVGLVNF